MKFVKTIFKRISKNYITKSEEYNKKNNFMYSIKLLKKAKYFDHKNPSIYFLIGENYLKIKDHLYYNHSYYRNKAIPFFSKSIKLNPNYIDALYKRGVAYYNEIHTPPFYTDSELEFALNDFNTLLKLSYDNELVHYFRGNILLYKGFINYEIIESYTNAIRLKQNFIEAYHNRGITYFFLKKYDESYIDFTEAINIDKNYKSAFFNRGLVNIELKNYENAISDLNYSFCLTKDSEKNKEYLYCMIYKNIAKAFTYLKKFDEARVNYNYSLRYSYFIRSYFDHSFPESSIYLARGQIKIYLKDFIGAIEDFNEIIFRNKSSFAFYNSRGVAKAYLYDFESAINDFSNIIKNHGMFTSRNILCDNYYKSFKNKDIKDLKDYYLSDIDNEDLLLIDLSSIEFNNKYESIKNNINNKELKIKHKGNLNWIINSKNVDINLAIIYFNRGICYAFISEFEKMIDDLYLSYTHGYTEAKAFIENIFSI